MSPLLLDHIWQSTVVLAVIGLLTLFFCNNGAHVRHALWTAASLKCLAPFALLNDLGVALTGLTGLKLPRLDFLETLYVAGEPFSDGPIFRALPALSAYLRPGMVVWAKGLCVVAALGLTRWSKLRATLRAARYSDIAAPMTVKLSSAQLEPGLVGISRPVLLLPEGITGRLSPAELRAVIAHEVCHTRRRDNLWSWLHMLAEAMFWFWPPVWWLGARLIAERERACDEAVLAAGNDPETYAESILKVCKFYVKLPLACAAGIAAADLSKRMETIMESRMVIHLTGMKKSLLGGAAGALVLMPIAIGLLWSPAAQGAACEVAPVMSTHTLPPYPADSKRLGDQGSVSLRVTVARNGHVQKIVTTHGSGFARLDEAATSFVQQKNYLWRSNTCGPAQTNLNVVWKLKPASGAAPTAKP